MSKQNNIYVDVNDNLGKLLAETHSKLETLDNNFIYSECQSDDLKELLEAAICIYSYKWVTIHENKKGSVVRCLYSCNRRRVLRICTKMILLGEMFGYSYPETRNFLFLMKHILANSSDYP